MNDGLFNQLCASVREAGVIRRNIGVGMTNKDDNVIIFNDVGNYRGDLQILSSHGKYYWKVSCDIGTDDWMEIPEYLYSALVKFNNNGMAK